MRATPREKRQRVGRTARAIANLIRALPATATAIAAWTLRGFSDGDNTESIDDVPIYQGVGFAARPKSGHGEAVLAHLGGESNSPIVIATRDRFAAAQFEQVAGQLGEGETAVFTEAGAYIKLDAQGNVVVVPAATGTVKVGRAPDLLLPVLQGVMTGESVDVITGVPHGTIGNASAVVMAQKT